MSRVTLAAIDLAALGLHGFGHVAARDRAVKLAAFAGLADHHVGFAVELLALLFSGGLGLGVAFLDDVLLGLEALQAHGVGAQGLGAGEQEVAGEPVLHRDDVADGAQALDAFQKNDFHDPVSLISRRRGGGPKSARA